jgi:hypothetical protein
MVRRDAAEEVIANADFRQLLSLASNGNASPQTRAAQPTSVGVMSMSADGISFRIVADGSPIGNVREELADTTDPRDPICRAGPEREAQRLSRYASWFN